MTWHKTRPSLRAVGGCTSGCLQVRAPCDCADADDRHLRHQLRAQRTVIAPSASHLAELHTRVSRLQLVQTDGGGRLADVWQPSKPVRPYCRRHWALRAWCDMVPALRPLARALF